MQEKRFPFSHSREMSHNVKGFSLITICIIMILNIISCTSVAPTLKSPPQNQPAPDLETEPYESISASMSAGRPEEAVEKFENAYSENPESIETQLLYSSLLITTGQVEKAELTIRKILSSAPDNTEALYNLALIKAVKEDQKAQQLLLEQVISLDPTHASAYAALGELFLEKQKLDEAEEQFIKSIQNNPRNLVARTGYGHVLLSRKKYPEAEEQLNQAIEIDPKYPFAYVDRSKARSGNGNINGALDDLSTAIELDPAHFWNYIDRGNLYLHIGNMEGALEDFNQAIELKPDYFLAYVYRAGILNDLSDYDAAYDTYRTLISLKEDYYPAYEPLALIAYNNEKYSEAAMYFKRHYQRFRKDHGHALMAGISLLFAGEEQKAVDYLKSNMESMQDDTCMYDIARLFTEKGYESYLLTKLVNEKNITLKIRALFYLATYYKLHEEIGLANTYFLEVADANIYGLFETELAHHELSGKIEE